MAVPLSPARADGTGGIITRRIPSSGEQLPIIGLGTSQTFEVGTTAAEREPQIAQAFG